MKKLITGICVLLPLGLLGQQLNTVNTPLPLDPAVRTGKLANGFSYFIRHNETPRNRVVFYLVNKVGSILEDDDQRGLAHFMEHMSFNGTTHFPKSELVNYLQKSGVRFGADLNAYTSFDETIYQLPLPSDDPELVKNGLQIMRDWAHEATLDAVEIDKERGVVLEEKRLGKGANERIQRQYLPVLINNSRYAHRQPIGTDEILNNFKPSAIKRFYEDWYRPDLQALVVVGDIDVNQVEQAIKLKFADLKNPVNEKPRVKYNIALSGKNQFLALTDKELTSVSGQVLILNSANIIRTVADYRNDMVTDLFNMMIKNRFAELTRREQPPFESSSVGIQPFLDGLNMFAVTVNAKPGELESGFKAIWRETERVKKFGFTIEELERAKKSYLNRMEAAYKERSKTPSNYYVNQYVQYFLKGTAAPDIEVVYNLIQKDVPGITLSDLNGIAAKYITESNRNILFTAPEKDKGQLPDEATALRWMSEVAQEKQDIYKEEGTAQALLTSSPMGGRIVAEKQNDDLKIVTYVLNNGVKVVVKPTEFKNNEVSFSAFAPGGTSLYADADYQSASNAAGLISAGGVGNFNNSQLQKYLSDKQAHVLPYINERMQGINGAATNKDLETAMQLIYGYFTQPRKDNTVFQNLIARTKAGLIDRGNDPKTVFQDTITAVLSNYSNRRSAPSIAKVEQINLDKAYSIYKERFADASGFTFIFVGSIDTALFKPLIEKYLGGLPSTHQNIQAKDLGIHIPEGKITKTVYKGSEPKATVDLVFSGDLSYNQENKIKLNALKEVLNIRLLERLREDESGVYSPGVSVSTGKYPKEKYAMIITFGCSPQNVEKLIASTIDEIEKLKKDGPPQVNIDKYKAEDRRAREVSLNANSFWLGYLNTQLQNNSDVNEMKTYSADMEKVTPESIKQMAQKCLSGNNYIRLVLLPETIKPQ